jgi:hypothetical protein
MSKDIKMKKRLFDYEKRIEMCGNERPARKVFCQLEKGHQGSHQAVIFWETEK